MRRNKRNQGPKAAAIEDIKQELHRQGKCFITFRVELNAPIRIIILKNKRRCVMADAILQFLLGIALGCGIIGHIDSWINGKKINDLEERVNKLNKQVNELIDACNANTKHIDELVLASTDTMKIVAEHIDAIKKLQKEGN